MSDSIVIIILIIALIAMVFVWYFCIYRNDRLLLFKFHIVHLCTVYDILHPVELNSEEDAFKWFEEKYTYNQMLFSFKPLKLEAWYTPEEISKIQGE